MQIQPSPEPDARSQNVKPMSQYGKSTTQPDTVSDPLALPYLPPQLPAKPRPRPKPLSKSLQEDVKDRLLLLDKLGIPVDTSAIMDIVRRKALSIAMRSMLQGLLMPPPEVGDMPGRCKWLMSIARSIEALHRCGEELTDAPGDPKDVQGATSRLLTLIDRPSVDSKVVSGAIATASTSE